MVMGIAWVFPDDGIRVTDSWTLQFHWDISSLSGHEVSYANINTIIQENQKLVDQDSLQFLDSTENAPLDTLRAAANEFKGKIQPIEYPSGDSSLLLPFFKELDIAHQKRVRVWHYGDSQIEGDRITGYLRNQFQKRFGGSGPGLMPVVPAHAESSSILHNSSENWYKHAVYFPSDTILSHRKFGVLGSFARFTSYQQDSLPQNFNPVTASIEFGRSGMAYQSVNHFNNCHIFYGNSHSPFLMRGYINDSLIWFEEVDTTTGTKSIQWELEKAPKKFRIEFEGAKSPDVYGIALDASTGVSVDNLPFRGSAGSEFTRMNQSQFRAMASNLNPGLVIFEFGVNVVPYQVKNFDFYERILTQQLSFLKRTLPDATILVIGVSDMSVRKGNYFETYPSLLKVLQAQKEAAKNTGCAFWDLYSAMGGKNSMPSWVFAEPPLASPDFIHFNRQGGHLVAQMLFNALMHEYQKYRAINNEQLTMSRE
ncbi:MAG TPA: hypothetical protein DCQ26_02165 [Marinilabiliales bacterium]|nr:hypothetical protein [Marinilabiliales bacterium]HAZ03658.1 hypothetical protein [Marinilabiliales bacterium]